MSINPQENSFQFFKIMVYSFQKVVKKMPKPIKKRQPHKYADRFYDYLMAHREQVLRYLVLAVISGLLHFFISRMIPLESGMMIGYGIRFLILFYGAKYWVYKEWGSGFFYTARQIMLAIMAVVLMSIGANYLTLFLGNRLLIGYVMQGVYEIAVFLVYQFLIFKQED